MQNLNFFRLCCIPQTLYSHSEAYMLYPSTSSSLPWDFSFFFWHVFQSSSYFDFDLHPFQLLICSMLVIVLVFPADVQLDNAFTPLEATAPETLSFLSSLLLRLFGVGLFISLPATGVSRVPRPLLFQRFLWSRQELVPGGVHYATLHVILCYIKRVV